MKVTVFPVTTIINSSGIAGINELYLKNLLNNICDSGYRKRLKNNPLVNEKKKHEFGLEFYLKEIITSGKFHSFSKSNIFYLVEVNDGLNKAGRSIYWEVCQGRSANVLP